MKTIEMICINCPRGCQLTVHKGSDGALQVSGNSCDRGIDYAHDELENPMRMVTTTVKTDSAKTPRVSVKSSSPIPVGEILPLMEKADIYTLKRACYCGEVLIAHVCGDIDLIATQEFTSEKRGNT